MKPSSPIRTDDEGLSTTKNIRAVLKASFLVVFIGWMVLWVILPTKLYENTWTPSLAANLNLSFIGAQGTNLLLFTFPIMFIAVFSCVYLHLGEKFQNKYTKSHPNNKPHLGGWSKPVFVKAPLGILTWTEIVFSVMFIALLIWSLGNYLYVTFTYPMVEDWQTHFGSVSLRLGYIGHMSWAFLFFPVTRGSSILHLVGLTSESSIKYHIWLGHLSMVLFTAHSLGIFIYWAMKQEIVEALEWSATFVSNVAGEIAFVLALVIWATSITKVRRKMFELFFYSHQIYTIYVFFYMLHVGVTYLASILPGIFLFLIDRYLRFLQSRQKVRLVSARVLPCETIELNFAKSPGLKYTPTSIVFMNVPSVSKLQWHPFTVASNCSMEPDKLSVIIKCGGDWSQKLYKKLSSPSSIDRLDVSIEGPYGPTSDFFGHDALVMISGGAGITPMFSIIREIIYRRSNPSIYPTVPRVVLICSFRTSSEIAMLDLLLPISGTPLDISSIQLQIEAYVTRETEQSIENTKKLVQTIWFKPLITDVPMTQILGQNSWLWLGAIIASSFVMFVLSLCILTQYYIYPIDKNTDMIYHYSGRILWDIFFACVCIVAVASVAFIWIKKQNSMEEKQVQNAGSLPIYCGQELESVPLESLAEATKLNFGARPDLKNILLNCKESDVGVLVCAPKKMRHEVARICSSGLVDNLHFEAMSFKW